MPKVIFAIPETLINGVLFTETGRWLVEEELHDFSFAINKNIDKLPAELKDSFYVAGEDVTFSALEEEKLDRVLETIKLYLASASKVVEEPKIKVPVENFYDTAETDSFVEEAMFRLSVMPIEEQVKAMEELYKKVQVSLVEHVNMLEEAIDTTKESSFRLHKVFSQLKPEWKKRKG